MRKFVRAQTAKRLKTLDREVRSVAKKPKDADAIHDLRVSIRRFRQELNVFEEWFKPGPVKRIRGNLKKLMERCAAVRNCDIAVEVLRAAKFPSTKLVAGLEHERQRTRKELSHTLASWRRRDRIRKWREHLRIVQPSTESGPGTSVREIAERQLPAMLGDFFRAGAEAARSGSTHRRMHELRLEAKRVRYSVELFKPVYGEQTKPILEALKELQDKLGAINDCATTLEMIRQNRSAAAAVRRLAAGREAEFRGYWKQHFGSGDQAQWKAVLSTADGIK